MEEVKSFEPIEIFNSISLSFLQGLIRLTQGRIVSNSLKLIMYKFYSTDGGDYSNSSYEAVLEEIGQIAHEEFDSFVYLNNASQLVYATTLFDTYISEVTRFMFLLNPSSIGPDQVIRLKEVLKSEDRSDLINELCSKKVRELGFLLFLARLGFLESRFGVMISLDSESISSLEHYSTLRNTLIHDQSIFDIILDKSGDISLIQKTCPLHPTIVTDDDVKTSWKAYFSVCRILYQRVMEDVISGEPISEFFDLIESIEKAFDA